MRVQAWRQVHPPKRGRWGQRPLCHMGFLKSWMRNDLNLRVTERVVSLLSRDCKRRDGAPVRIIITGVCSGFAIEHLASQTMLPPYAAVAVAAALHA